MTPDDMRKQDPGAAKTTAQAAAFREAMGTEAAVAATQADLVRALQAQQVNPFAQLQNVNPYWQQNLGMTTQVLPGVAGAQSFNAAALSTSVPDFYTSTHRQ